MLCYNSGYDGVDRIWCRIGKSPRRFRSFGLGYGVWALQMLGTTQCYRLGPEKHIMHLQLA